MQIKTMAILGAGAVGSYFLWGLHAQMGDSLMIVADGERRRRLETDGITINEDTYHPAIRTPEEARGVDLLLVATKHGALQDVLDDIETIADAHTIVLSPLNGVDSEEIIGGRIGMEHMLYSIMLIASERKGGSIRFDPAFTRGIVFGEADGAYSERVKAVEAYFNAGKVKNRVSGEILKELWQKYAFNVSMNLPQAILNVGVGAYVDSEHMAALRWSLRAEIAALAAAKGVDISELSGIESVDHPSPPPARYSTLQDLDAGRPTEIDMLAKTACDLGKQYGIPTPYCEFCYHAVRVLEEKNEGKFVYD